MYNISTPPRPNQQLSQKIHIMQLICCILVVYIHYNVTSEFPTVCGFNTNWIQYFIRHILGSLAVPTFFCISGYLFFQGIETMKDVKEKMKKRAKTLIIPYLIGCFICFIITLFSQEEPIEFLQSKSVAEQLFYIFFPRYNQPLWYVRNLILIVLISPLLFYVRQLGFLVVLGIPAFILSTVHFPYVICGQFIASVYWFMLGAYFFWKPFNKYLSFALLAYVIANLFFFTPKGWIEVETSLWQIFGTTAGVVGLWAFYDIIISKKFNLKDHRFLKFCCLSTFFVYVYHMCLLGKVCRLCTNICGSGEIGSLVTFLFAPLVTFCILVALFWIMNKYIPQVLSVILGGRVPNLKS